MRQELWIIGEVGRPDQIPRHASGTRFENEKRRRDENTKQMLSATTVKQDAPRGENQILHETSTSIVQG